MSGIFRSSNTNPNPPLFYAQIVPGLGGTALGPALRNLGINTDRCWARNGTSTPYLAEGLYFSVSGSQTFRVYGNSGESGNGTGQRHSVLLANQYHFMPIGNPENLWIIGSATGVTLGVRGH